MSKAFTRDDASPEPLFVPKRAPLPPGVPNYVTERGLALLQAERESLLTEHSAVSGDDDETRLRLGASATRLRELDDRIASARVVPPPVDALATVRFGATIRLRSVDGDDRQLRQIRLVRLVGVDEADPSAGDISVFSPLAKALIGLEAGDIVTMSATGGNGRYEILDVRYS